MIAQVPTTITVDAAAAAAKVSVTYDGVPNFNPIQGTTMTYATNTAQKVIQVGDVYLLCFQGVWFLSTNPQGPWQTAPSVPQEIYTIPPSSPIYNVTYVTQSTSPDGNVQASYTAGYLGAFVMGAAVGAVVAGGTGYYYPPYIYHPAMGYPVYDPYPHTYGAMPYYHNTTGAYGVSQTAYGAYGSATRTASYNPYTGTSARTARSPRPMGTPPQGQRTTPTRVRRPPPSKAQMRTAPGAAPRFPRTAKALTRNTTQHHRGRPAPCRPLQVGRPWEQVERTGTAQRPPSRQTAICTRAQTVTSTKTLAVDWQKYGSNGSWNSVNQRRHSPQPHEQFQLRAASYQLPLHPLPTTHRAARRKACNRKRRTDTEANNRASATLSSVRVADGGIAAAVAVAGEEVVVEGEDSQTL